MRVGRPNPNFLVFITSTTKNYKQEKENTNGFFDFHLALF